MVSHLNIFVWKWSKIAAQKKIKFCCWFCLTKHGGNQASWWIRDLWSKGISLTLAYLWTCLSFCILDDFFRFSKKMGVWVFLVHPTVVLVLLSASVERCFVSRMQDLYDLICNFIIFTESALGRFFHRVVMSVCRPFSCNFFAWKNWCGASLVQELVWSVRRPRVEP